MIDVSLECLTRFVNEQEYLDSSKPVNLIQPIVSVSVPTYQHVSFIKQCLDSVLMQKTSFPFEIIIGEDGSIDGTREICIDYANAYPEKIRLFLRNRKTSQLYDKNGNFLARFNGRWNRMSARGKYLAWCEGDDYWTDPNKLQKQVDYLESHPEYSFCCHRFKIFVQNKNIFANEYAFRYYKINQDLEIDLDLFSRVWITQPLTAVIRKEVYDIISNDFEKHIGSRDVHMFYYLLKKGNGISLNQFMGVYRHHDLGVASSVSTEEKFKRGYLTYKDLYKFNREDEHLRRKYFYNLIGSLRFGTKKSFYYNYSIFKEGMKIASHITEIFNLMFSFFFPRVLINGFYILYSKVKKRCHRARK
jgi:glycosyltransferase involved in cell wall biosynthesis